MGALASGGGIVMNDNVVASLDVSDEQMRAVIDREAAELRRREHAYRGDRPPADPRGKIVILVDDGIATGASMFAAVRAVRAVDPEIDRRGGAGRPDCGVRELNREADDVVCASNAGPFEAVGQVFADFHQVTDDEVRELLTTPPELSAR